MEWRFLNEPDVTQSPRSGQQGAPRCGWARAIFDQTRELVQSLTIPRLCAMIMQGIFSTTPWTVMGNTMLHFQLCGIDDGKASVLTSEQSVTGAVGSLLGGYIADFLARRLGYQGRPLTAQISVASGIPRIYLVSNIDALF